MVVRQNRAHAVAIFVVSWKRSIQHALDLGVIGTEVPIKQPVYSHLYT